MAIDKRFLFYYSEAGFLSDKNKGNINDESIAFISEGGKRAIYTHGVYFSPDAFVVGTQTSSTNAFTGEFNEIDKLYDGLSIKYWIPFNGTSSEATLNLTINGTATGAIPVYIEGTTRFTNHIGAYNVLHLTYRENVGSIAKGWWVLSSFGDKADGDTTYSFASGTDGSFKVQPSNGHEQTISVGKPEKAGTADKVAKSFTIQVNSGTEEDVSFYNFDGSAARYLNIKSGNNIKFDTEDGELIISGNYQDATTSASGLMSSTDKGKLDDIEEGANKYTHPEHDEASLGLYKIKVDAEGHVESAIKVTKSDITDGLGIPEADTHYSSKNVVGSSSTATSNTTTALSNSNVYLNSVENDAVTSSHKISGSGSTTVKTDASGNIEINSPTTIAWGSITGKPSTFAPSEHDHIVSEITDLETQKFTFNGTEYLIYTPETTLPTFYAPSTLGSNGQVLKSDGTKVYWAKDNNDNTWRSIALTDGTTDTSVLGTGTDTGSLKFKAGSNVSLSASDGVIIISSEDKKAKVTTGTTTKSYLVGVNASGYISGNATDKLITDTGVYLDNTAGKLIAKTFAGQLSGTITAGTTATTQEAGDKSTKVATTEFVNTAISTALGELSDALIFKGIVNSASDIPATHEVGWVYRVGTPGTYVGKKCEVGDMIICITAGDEFTNSHWTIAQNNIDGAVTGSSSSSTPGNFAIFDGIYGKVIKDSGKKASDFTYTAGTGLSLSNNEFSIDSSLTAGSYGPSSNVTGTNGTTISVPQITVDENGLITEITQKTYTSKDTDTHYTTGLYVGATGEKKNAATTNGNTYIKLYDNDTSRASFKISGSGNTTVTSDASGNITINSTDSNTTYSLSGALSGNTFVNTLTSSGGTKTTSTVPVMGGASSSDPGTAGLVPAPDKGGQDKYLKADGSWDTPYTHPTYAKVDGKPDANATPGFGGTFTVTDITTNTLGHVTGGASRTITIPSATATTSAAGLMSSADKTKLNGIAAGATANTGTVTSVTIKGGDGITVSSTEAIITSGIRTISLSESGVTVNSSTGTKTYGDTEQQKPEHSGTFNIPYFTVDKYGRITEASTTTVTLPASGNTDTKVTSAINHYTPAKDDTAALSVDASGATSSASWGSTNLVTGVNLQRDAKGHVTGVTVDSIKMPGNPNTTYSAGKGLTLSSTTFNVGAGNGIAVADDTVSANLRSTTKLTNDSSVATETSDRIYPVALDKSGYLAVNVPWEKYTLPKASDNALGGIKIAKDNKYYTIATNTSPAISANVTTLGKYYGVEIDKNGKAYVYVPWEDTTYTAEKGISLSNDKKFGHSNTKINAKTEFVDSNASIEVSSNDGSFEVTDIKYDAFGHITGSQDRTIKITEAYKGTVTSIKISAGDGISVTNGVNANDISNTAITSSGTRKISVIPATKTTFGGIKASNVLTTSVSLTSGDGTTASRYYGVQIDKDGKAFVNVPWTADSNTYTSAYCSTAASTAAKTASCTNYVLTSKTYLHITITNSNSAASALTLNVNSKGAKTIYINGTASSSSNYTLPAGTYIVYYDGSYYHFRTDGVLPGKIVDANTVSGKTISTTVSSDSEDATIPTSKAVYTAISSGIKANDAMIFKGVINSNSGLPASHKLGDTYRIGAAGTYAGQSCEVGDIIICTTTSSSASNSHWTVIQTNIDGAVVGPAEDTKNENKVAIFDGTTGKVIKSSGYTIASNVPSEAVFTDTKNTAGSDNTTSKIFLVGTSSQTTNNGTARTYSNSKVYVKDNYLYSNDTKVSVEGHSHSYLPLSGGTITGSIVADGSGSTSYCPFIYNFTYSSTTGWARDLASIRVDGKSKFTIGAYGNYTVGSNSNEITYAYIGCNGHAGDNLRITSSDIKWGNNLLLHAGNYTNYFKNYYNSTTSRTANTVLAAPNGSNGPATFRSLVGADLPLPTKTTLGGIKASNVLTTEVSLTSADGSTASRYYGVQIDKNGKAFVNVPWVNDNTTYTAGTGLSLSSTKFSTSAGLYNETSATTAAAAGWYRIATSPASITNCSATFRIHGGTTGKHTVATIIAGTSYGRKDSSNITVLQCSQYSISAFTKVRIVYHTSYSNNYAYLEVYNPNAAALPISVKIIGGYGWSLVTPSTAGSIPSGYSSKEVSLTDGTVYSEKFTGDGSGLTSLDASNISSGTIGSARLPDAATDKKGAIKIGKDNTNYSVTAGTSNISANVTSGKYYAVEIDKNDKAFVYVPWEDTTYSTKNLNVNGTNYAIYTSASALPTVYGPTSAGTAGRILVSNGSGAPSWQDCGGKVKSTTASVAIATSWGTLLSAANLGTLCDSTVGTYAIQIYGPSSIGYSSGVFTWNSANSGDANEILLHRTGASNSIYLRMAADRTLQIAASTAITSATTITVKVKRLI